MTQKFIRLSNRRSRRRSGTILVYMALGLFSFIGAASLAVDMGSLYSRRARAQQAADAAALAGANEFANFRANAGNPAPARTQALRYAELNGYKDATGGVTVTTIYPVGGDTSRFQADVRRTEPLFFARIFGLPTRPVGASATAFYNTTAPLDAGNGVYGQAGGPTTLTMYGPDGRYDFGDYRSVRFLTNGTPNPDYVDPTVNPFKAGYNFTVNVPTNFTSTVVEIYDPDCHNAGNLPYVAQDAQGNNIRVDELRKAWNSQDAGQGGPADAAVTRYTLYWDPTGSGNPSGFQKIGEKTYGDDATTDLKWDPSFTFDRTSYPSGNFVLNATTISGSSENGFKLRAGPPRAAPPAGQDNFDPNNGTSITADGHVPINFAGNGTAPFVLGEVPQGVAGKTLTIRKFDTDIGSQTVNYSYVAPDGTVSQVFPGVLSGNGAFATDTITLPLDYPGGVWRADYEAGANDTSVWEMSYDGVPGRPGKIRLVR